MISKHWNYLAYLLPLILLPNNILLNINAESEFQCEQNSDCPSLSNPSDYPFSLRYLFEKGANTTAQICAKSPTDETIKTCQCNSPHFIPVHKFKESTSKNTTEMDCYPAIFRIYTRCSTDYDCLWYAADPIDRGNTPDRKPNAAKCIDGHCWECSFGKFLNSASGPFCSNPGIEETCKRSNYMGLTYFLKCPGTEDNVICNSNSECSCKTEEEDFDPLLNKCIALSGHGEGCNPSQRCISNLECSPKGKCACPPNGPFNPQTVKCTGATLHKTCNKDDLPCNLPNQACSSYSNTCFCTTDSYEVDGQCQKLHYARLCAEEEGFMENDSHDAEIHQREITTQRLDCYNGRYYCKNAMEQKYDTVKNKCVNALGTRCEPTENNECYKHSVCSPSAGNLNGNDSQFTCQCPEGMSPTPEGECRLDFGQECTNRICNNAAGLVCKNETCQCSQSDGRIVFDNTLKRCVAQDGYFCGIRDLNMQVDVGCLKGSECVFSFSDGSRRCQKRV